MFGFGPILIRFDLLNVNNEFVECSIQIDHVDGYTCLKTDTIRLYPGMPAVWGPLLAKAIIGDVKMDLPVTMFVPEERLDTLTGEIRDPVIDDQFGDPLQSQIP